MASASHLPPHEHHALSLSVTRPCGSRPADDSPALPRLLRVLFAVGDGSRGSGPGRVAGCVPIADPHRDRVGALLLVGVRAADRERPTGRPTDRACRGSASIPPVDGRRVLGRRRMRVGIAERGHPNRPSRSVGAGRDVRARGRDRLVGRGQGDLPDVVAAILGEPEVAIGPGRDAKGTARGRGDGQLGHDPTGGDLSDVVRAILGEPEVAIGPGRDADGKTPGRGDGELGHDPAGGDAPDVVAAPLREPEVAIGPGRDVLETARGRGDGELGHDPAGGDAPDLVA